jgi:WD domain, G-beta repeat
MSFRPYFAANQGDDDEVPFRIPDKDVYRRNISTFGSVYAYIENRYHIRTWKDRRLQQPHYYYLRYQDRLHQQTNTNLPLFTSYEFFLYHHLTTLLNTFSRVVTPYGNRSTPVDGICTRFLRKGLIKPNKTQMTAAVWSNDARWLALGTQTGDLARWEGDTLKVQKLVSVSAHKTLFDGDRVKEAFAISAMAWDKSSNLLITADTRGTMQYCDETFRNVLVISEAHSGAVRGVSFSPTGSKIVSAGDDSVLHIWGVGQDKPERTLSGHQSDVKAVDWHPYRALIASASRDATMRLWDPRQEAPVR